MKFNHLNVPTHWRNYWSRYPEGHTILEALISWVSQVDSMVDNQNKLNDNVAQFRKEIDEFVERFDERLQTEVTQTLKDWQDSGFLDVVISEALQWQLDDYIATNEQDKVSLTTQLQQTEQELNAQLAQTENEITTHVNKPDVHKPIRVFEREPNSAVINTGDLLFIYDNFLDWTPTKWEVGSLQSGNGEALPATHRVRTKDYISITPGEYKSFVTGPTIYMGSERGTANYLFYTESNLFISTTSWVTNGSTITIPSNAVKMKALVRLPDDSDVDANLANDTIKPVLTKVYG